MKTKLLSTLLCACMLFSYVGSKAQNNKLLHYWHFNNTLPTTGAGGTHFGTSKMNSDYSRPSVTTGYLRFVKVAGCLADTGYWDNILGDSINQRVGYGACCPVFGATVSNSGVRTRNPTDSMQFLWYIPTKNFKNIKLTWESMASSTATGQHRMNYKYSLDSGATWITTSWPKLFDSAGLAWGKIVLNLNTITTINNLNKLMLRINFSVPNTGTSGNNRFDNITVEGDSIVAIPNGITEYKNNSLGCELYPNPSSDNVTLVSASKEPINVSFLNVLGQVVYVCERKENDQSPINVSGLSNGLYYVNITEQNSKKTQSLKFVKN